MSTKTQKELLELFKNKAIKSIINKHYQGNLILLDNTPIQLYEENGEVRAKIHNDKHNNTDIIQKLIKHSIYNFSYCDFLGDVDCNNYTFDKRAYFQYATFSKTADFTKATFSKTADFTKATFSKTADFQYTIFSQTANFTKAIFSNIAYFQYAIFSNIAYFQYAIFSQTAYFKNVIFSQTAYFKNAIFNQTAYFSATIFNKAEESKDTSSNCKTFFHFATFKKEAYFNNSAFKGKAYFKSTTFKKKAKFFYVTFEKRAYFTRAIFEAEADFNHATFVGVAYFDKEDEGICTIKNANFSYCRFEETAYFTEANITHLALEATQIKKDLFFYNTTIEALETRETARIIKNEFYKQNNNIEAHKYYVREMELYRKELKKELELDKSKTKRLKQKLTKLKRKELKQNSKQELIKLREALRNLEPKELKQKLKKLKRKELKQKLRTKNTPKCIDLFNLRFQQLVTNHGQNWLKGLGWLLGISLTFAMYISIFSKLYLNIASCINNNILLIAIAATIYIVAPFYILCRIILPFQIQLWKYFIPIFAIILIILIIFLSQHTPSSISNIQDFFTLIIYLPKHIPFFIHHMKEFFILIIHSPKNIPSDIHHITTEIFTLFMDLIYPLSSPTNIIEKLGIEKNTYFAITTHFLILFTKVINASIIYLIISAFRRFSRSK